MTHILAPAPPAPAPQDHDRRLQELVEDPTRVTALLWPGGWAEGWERGGQGGMWTGGKRLVPLIQGQE